MKKSTEKFLQRISTLGNNEAKLNLIHSKINFEKEAEVLTVKQLQAIYAHISTTAKIADQIDSLEPNQSIRLVKTADSANPLPRTCVIQKFPDHHVELIVMPNRKLANDEKVSSKPQNGSQKKKKVAYRIDDERLQNISYARLEMELGTDSPNQTAMTIERVTREANMSQQLRNSKYAAPIYIGTPFYHQRNGKRTQAIYAFAELGVCDLIDFKQALSPEELAAYNTQHTMPQFLQPIITSLIRGLCDMEALQIIHVDIDFRNIMLFRDQFGQLITKYIDFDNAIDLKLGPSRIMGGTHLVLAPDIFKSNLEHMSNSMPNGREKAIYMWNQRESYGWSVFYKAMQQGITYPDRIRVDFKDSCWSIGVIIFQLLTQRLPRLDEYTKTTIAQNPLLQGLLAPTREKRFSAAQALACWEQNPQLIFESRLQEQYTMREFLELETAKMNRMRDASAKAEAKQKQLQETLRAEARALQDTLAELSGLLNMSSTAPVTPAFTAATTSTTSNPATPAAPKSSNELSGLKKGFLL